MKAFWNAIFKYQLVLLGCLSVSVCLADDTSAHQETGPQYWSARYVGSADNQSTEIQRDIFKTIYVSREVPDTCTRTVEVGSERKCSKVPRQNCRTIPGECSTRNRCYDRQVCETVWQRVCYPGHESCYQERVCDRFGCRVITRCDPPRPVCENRPQQVCRNQPECHSERYCEPDQQQCTTTYEDVCKDVPITRQESYECTRTVSDPKRVFDYHLKTQIQVQFEAAPDNAALDETFQFTQAGTELDVNLSDSSNNALLKITNSRQESRVGDQKTVKVSYRVKPYIKTAVMQAAQGMMNAQFDGENLLVRTGKIVYPELFIPSLKLTYTRPKVIVNEHKTVLDRELYPNEYQVLKEANSSLLVIPLRALGAKPERGDLWEVDFWSQVYLRRSDFINGESLPQPLTVVRQRLLKEIKI